LNGATTNIIQNATDLNNIFRQLDVVSSKLDGELNNNNKPKLYDLSGDTFFAPATTEGSLSNVFTVKVPEAIKKFEGLLSESQILTENFKPNSSTIENGNGCTFNLKNTPLFVTCANNRFYIAMSPLFTKSDLLTSTINELTSGNEIKSNPALVSKIDEVCRKYADFCNKDANPSFNELFVEVKANPIYKEVTTFTLPDNTVKICQYTTDVTQDVNQKNLKIEALYSNNNLNNNKDTFNGKVTFN
jgi:hypothetical protein